MKNGRIVIAPWGSNTWGDDILMFEHGILFGLETALDSVEGFSYADIHAQTGGPDKRSQATAPLTETEIRSLADRADCDVVIDGMLTADRDGETAGLTVIEATPRIYYLQSGTFDMPYAFTFKSFFRDDTPERLSLDFDHYIAFQYRLAEIVLDLLEHPLPGSFTTDNLQITMSLDAYVDFLKAKRVAKTAELKLGYYEQALQHDRDFYWALYNSGMLYKNQTDYHSARTRFLRAAGLTTDTEALAEIYFELGLCSIFLGDTKTARNFWEEALEYSSDHPTLLVNMAGTFEQEENLTDAIRWNERAVEIAPDHHKAVVNLARLCAMRGDLDRAIPLYERALKLEPDDALRHSVVGGCYLAAGEADLARPHFRRAVELDLEGDPGKYAQQELEKLGEARPKARDDEPKKKRWGLF